MDSPPGLSGETMDNTYGAVLLGTFFGLMFVALYCTIISTLLSFCRSDYMGWCCFRHSHTFAPTLPTALGQIFMQVAFSS